MKRMISVLMTATLCLSILAGCGSQKPSLDEVEQAISEGNMTIEDALDKGWVTQDWADSYLEEHSVKAADKIESYMVTDFTSTTVGGDEFTKGQMNKVTFFAFADVNEDGIQDFYESLVEGYGEVADAGADIVLCLKGEGDFSLFQDAPFSVILYNDSLKEGVKVYGDIIESEPFAGSWYVDGSFLSAWISEINLDDLVSAAEGFVEMQKMMENETETEDGGAAMMG